MDKFITELHDEDDVEFDAESYVAGIKIVNKIAIYNV